MTAAAPTVGAIVQHARHRAGLSRRELADRCQIDGSTLYRIETGQHPRPHMDTLRTIADALDVDLLDLAQAREAAPR